MDKYWYKKYLDRRIFAFLGLLAILGAVYYYVEEIDAPSPADQYGVKTAYLDMGPASKGVYLTVWTDTRNGNEDIVGAIVKPNNKNVNSNFPLTAAKGSQSRVAVAANTKNKEFMVIWADDRDSIGLQWKIYAQRVNYDGSLIGSNFAVTNDPYYDCYNACNPAIAYNSKTNEYLVIWDDYKSIPPKPYIYVKVISYDGKFIGATNYLIPLQSIPYGYVQLNPSVAYNSKTNKFLVVYEERSVYNNKFDDYSIGGVDVDAAGKPEISFTISAMSLSAHITKLAPQVTYNEQNDINLVVWEDYRNDFTNKADIYGILMDSYGIILPEFAVANLQGSSQTEPSVSSSTLGFLVTYTDDQNQWLEKKNIYAQAVDFSGNIQGKIFAISNDNSDQEYNSVAFAVRDTSYLIVWTDWRNQKTTDLDTYGQHISYKGMMLQTKSNENFMVSVNRVTGLLKP